MRSVSLFMMVSLDGYFEGPDHDLSWHNVDDEFNEFAALQLDNAGVLLFGHRTYDLMAGYWPTPAVKKADPIIAGKMNDLPKLVFSTRLFRPEWNNTRRVSSDIPGQLAKLKAEDGGDLLVLGSSNLCVSLLEMALLDELRLMINPAVIGQGTPLFTGLKQPLKLDLTNAHRFKSGNELLTYKVRS